MRPILAAPSPEIEFTGKLDPSLVFDLRFTSLVPARGFFKSIMEKKGGVYIDGRTVKGPK